MNIRQAILKAADHIERNPDDFKFTADVIPHECGTPGCALGWIGFFAGLQRGMAYYTACEPLGLPVAPVSLEEGERSFYDRMHGLADGWIDSAEICAAGLRRYADKYHSAAA